MYYIIIILLSRPVTYIITYYIIIILLYRTETFMPKPYSILLRYTMYTCNKCLVHDIHIFII